MHRKAAQEPRELTFVDAATFWSTFRFRFLFPDADRPVDDARGAGNLPLICRNVVKLPQPAPKSPQTINGGWRVRGGGRHVSFGIDNARLGEWEDCGRLVRHRECGQPRKGQTDRAGKQDAVLDHRGLTGRLSFRADPSALLDSGSVTPTSAV